MLFAGIPVTDLQTAGPWYERLLGRPADVVVHQSEVMWQLAPGGWLYVVANPGRAGRSLASIAVADLEAALEAIAGRGIPRPDIEVVSDAGRKATVTDPDGNEVSLLEVAGD